MFKEKIDDETIGISETRKEFIKSVIGVDSYKYKGYRYGKYSKYDK